MHVFKSILDLHLENRIEKAEAEGERNVYFDEVLYITHIKEDKWLSLSPKIYTIFWYLSLQNLYVPD